MFIVVLLVGLCIRVAVLSGGGEQQLIKVVPDDTFYYLETAKHIVAGDGSTFDGINPTNGYHPLWMVLLLPLAALISDPWTLLRSTLLMGLIFNVGAAVLLFAALRKRLNIWFIPVIGTAVYYLNVNSIISLNGLEIMVSSFFFALVLYLTFSDFDYSTVSLRRKALLGLSLGLLFLARTDNAFYILVFYAVAVWRTPSSMRIKVAALMAGIGALVASPWIIWNIVYFGSPIQSSGFAVPYVLRESFLADGHTTGEQLVHSAKFFLEFITVRFYGDYLGFPKTIYLPILAGTIYMIVRKWKQLGRAEYADARHVIKLVAALAAAALAVIFVHTFVRWYPRNYYFDQIIMLSAVGFVLCLTLLRPEVMLAKIRANSATLSRCAAVAVLFVAVAQVAYFLPRLIDQGVYPHQVEFYDAAQWLKENTSPEIVVAGFNVGITSYFSDRTVINLDGAINTVAVEAIKQKRLLAYVEEMGVDYIVDYDPVMFDMYRYFLGVPSPTFHKTVISVIDHPEVSWEDSRIVILGIKLSPDLSTVELQH